jgi:hypothetical protein
MTSAPSAWTAARIFPPRSSHLLITVLVLSALATVATEFRIVGTLSQSNAVVIVYAILIHNLVAAIAGLWAPHRIAWLVYALLSVAAFVLIGAATAINAVWLLARFFTGW